MTRFITMTIALVALITFASPGYAEEEKGPKVRPTGFTFDAGFVSAENAASSAMFGLTLNMGTFYKPWLHLATGFSRWSSDIDLDSPLSGTVRDLRIFGDLAFQPIEFQHIRPFVLAGLAAHFIDANVNEDASLADALSGTSYGPEIGFGRAVGRRFRVLSPGFVYTEPGCDRCGRVVAQESTPDDQGRCL